MPRAEAIDVDDETMIARSTGIVTCALQAGNGLSTTHHPVEAGSVGPRMGAAKSVANEWGPQMTGRSTLAADRDRR